MLGATCAPYPALLKAMRETWAARVVSGLDVLVYHGGTEHAERNGELARDYGFPSWPKLKQHVESLERVSIADAQAAPYLAMLVSTIYADAEKAFGKDKAKRGYKSAQQQVLGADTSALAGPDLAGKLPKV